MINLIPEQQKKEIQKEYYMHSARYALVLIGILSLASCVLFTPSYILSMSKKNAAYSEIASLKQGETFVLAQELQNTITVINEKLSIFPKKPVLASVVLEIVNEVEKVLPQGVNLISIRILSDVEKTRTVEVSGIANTRDTLLSFVKKLETTPRFTNVVLPVSSYAKGTNIPFTVSFTQK